jgi:hypothetical protein
MRLTLSSAAAPDLDLAGLAGAALRRGFTAVELVAGDGHGIEAGDRRAAIGAAARLAGEGVSPAAWRVAAADAELLAGLADFSAALGAPVLTPAPVIGAEGWRDLQNRYESAGAELLVRVTSPEEADQMLDVSRGDARLAWDVAASGGRIQDPAAMISACGDRLAYVALRGGGPEAMAQEGQGIGEMFTSLALARYSGPLSLRPSRPEFHRAWSAWLGRRGGWGCGSKAGGGNRMEPVALPVAGADR